MQNRARLNSGRNNPARMQHAGWRPVAVALSLYAVLLIALFHRLLVGDVLHPGAAMNEALPYWPNSRFDITPYVSDIHGDVWQHTIPFQRAQYEAGQAGRFPTWNPYIFCGFPFHANCQSAMLSPFNLPFFWIEPDYVRGPLAILRLWIAGSGAFLFARRFGISWSGSFLTGMTWMLGSFNIRWLLWVVPTAAMWLPMLLIALDRLVVAPTRARFAVAGFAAIILFLSGHPETQLKSGIVSAIFVLARVVHLGLAPWSIFARLAAAFLAMCTGLMGAAVALWPFIDQMLMSADWLERLRRRPALSIDGVILFLVPDFFGRPRARFSYAGPYTYVDASCAFGFLPLVLALGAIVWSLRAKGDQPPDERRWFCRVNAILFVFSLLLVFQINVVQSITERIPLLGQCNNVRFLLVTQLSGALLAGVGFDLFVSHVGSFTRGIIVSIAAATICVMVVLLAFTTRSPLRGELPDFGTLGALGGNVWMHHAWFRCSVAACLAILGAGAVVYLAIRFRGNPVGHRYAGIILFLVLCDLFWGAWGFNPICPPGIAEPAAWSPMRSLVERAGPQRIGVAAHVLVPNLGMRLHFREIGGYDMPTSARLVAVQRRLDLKPGWALLEPGRLFPSLDPTLASFLTRSGVSLVVSDVRSASIEVEADGQGEPSHWPMLMAGPGPLSVYMNPDAYRRAWFAAEVTLADPSDALDWLLDSAVDLREHTLIEHPTGDSVATMIPSEATGVATIIRDDPETVEIETRSDTGGLCVITDRWDPGWTVSIDGKAALPVIANYLFRGVVVPPGNHQVRWTYVCPKLREGTVVSAASICLLCGLAFSGVVRSRGS